MNYTPGEWSTGEWYGTVSRRDAYAAGPHAAVWAAGEDGAANLVCITGNAGHEVAIANARLIAAAPALIRLLEKARLHLTIQHKELHAEIAELLEFL